jgi:hypothetical protein
MSEARITEMLLPGRIDRPGGIRRVRDAGQLERWRAEPARAVRNLARGGGQDADQAAVADHGRIPQDRAVTDEAPVADRDRADIQPALP